MQQLKTRLDRLERQQDSPQDALVRRYGRMLPREDGESMEEYRARLFCAAYLTSEQMRALSELDDGDVPPDPPEKIDALVRHHAACRRALGLPADG